MRFDRTDLIYRLRRTLLFSFFSEGVREAFARRSGGVFRVFGRHVEDVWGSSGKSSGGVQRKFGGRSGKAHGAFGKSSEKVRRKFGESSEKVRESSEKVRKKVCTGVTLLHNLVDANKRDTAISKI